MNILFAGKTGFEYNRTQVIYKGLKQLSGINVQIFKLRSKRQFNKKEFNELYKNIDCIYIPPFRFSDARFLKKQTGIPIVFDPLVSVFLTKVIDYKQYWKAPQKYIADFINFRSCDVLIADTQHHKEYFSKVFKIPEKKIFVLPIGVDTKSYFPEAKENSDSKFHVGFYGSFIPLQGIHKIIETANVLKNNKDVVFDIVGDGYSYKSVKKLSEKFALKNVNFHGRIPSDKLPDYINKFDIALGIFGNSLKAEFVIPNKVFHYAAQKKCIITKNTAGIKEIFSDGDNILLTSNNPKEIAEKIILLKNNEILRNNIAGNAYHLITENYNEIKTAKKFIEICKSLNFV